jgi:hypothetical protein
MESSQKFGLFYLIFGNFLPLVNYPPMGEKSARSGHPAGMAENFPIHKVEMEPNFDADFLLVFAISSSLFYLSCTLPEQETFLSAVKLHKMK